MTTAHSLRLTGSTAGLIEAKGPGTRDSAQRWSGMRATRLDKSSAIERVGYDDTSRTLTIWFRGGRRYLYSGVERDTYESLCRAPSAGRFVNQAIRGRYPCRSDPARRRYP